jgi:hypothetical protein
MRASLMGSIESIDPAFHAFFTARAAQSNCPVRTGYHHWKQHFSSFSIGDEETRI